MNFAKFLRAPFPTEDLGRLLLCFTISYYCDDFSIHDCCVIYKLLADYLLKTRMVFDFYLIYWFFCCDYSDCYVVYGFLFHILTVICNILIIMLHYDYYVTYRLFCQIMRPYLLVKFHSEIKLSLSMVKTVYTFSPGWNFSPGWTHACEKETGMIFYLGMKKKRCVNTSCWDEI